MSIFPHLLELHDLAKREGAGKLAKRELYARIRKEKGRHFIGIVGPRGAGKTVILKQWAHEDADSIYLSADTLPMDADLFEIVRELQQRYHFNAFLIDEVHFLSDAQAALKKIHDFLEVRVIFTSSVALAMQASAHDLSRRVSLLPLGYFSFREYLAFTHGEKLEPLGWGDFLAGNCHPAHLRAGRFLQAYLTGGLLPFSLDEPDPLPLLRGTLDTIIERDIPGTLRLRVDELQLIRKLLAFTGGAAVDGISHSSLAKNLGITKYKAEQYTAALEGAFVMQRVFPAGTNVLREPKILLMPPLRLLYQPWAQVIGGLREDFFIFAMRQAGLNVRYLKGTRGQKTPDFLIEHEGLSIALEIGGMGKGHSQFKGITAHRKIVLAPDIAPSSGRLPLHLAGFLAPMDRGDWLRNPMPA